MQTVQLHQHRRRRVPIPEGTLKIVFIYETPEPFSEALENEIYERFKFAFEGQSLKGLRFPPVIWKRFGCNEFKNGSVLQRHVVHVPTKILGVTMTDLDYDKLATMVAEKIVCQTSKLTLSRSEVEVRLGFSPGSSAARKVMRDPKFPRPDAFTENGRDRWYAKDVENYINSKREERARKTISAA